jgi:hypothetical protein
MVQRCLKQLAAWGLGGHDEAKKEAHIVAVLRNTLPLPNKVLPMEAANLPRTTKLKEMMIL